MIWKGPKNFREVMARAGYTGARKDLERLCASLDLKKPPTPGSLKTACLGGKGRGFSKRETMDAICKALKCKRSDLYEERGPQDPQAHLSTWEWVSSGVDLEDHQSWPV